MNDVRYFKGIHKCGGREVVCAVYDAPQEGLTGTYIARITDVCRGNHKDIQTEAELAENVQAMREITKEEHDFFCATGHLITEIWMNQYTGGFPRESNVLSFERTLHTALHATINNLKEG